MIGAIIGDVSGSRFEFSNQYSKEVALLDDECEYTDDTVMTCAVAQAILECDADADELEKYASSILHRFARRYPLCGYGARFYSWMLSSDPRPYNSCGNGSAMRISPVGFAARDIPHAKALSHAVTAVTHNHPEGLKGAEATAVAMVLARQGAGKHEIRDYIQRNYGYDFSTSVQQYRDNPAGHGKEICQITVPQAFSCFFEAEDFEDAILNSISIGGDSDTIAAIAGGIAEAYYGVTDALAQQAKTYLPAHLNEVVRSFTEKYGPAYKKA